MKNNIYATIIIFLLGTLYIYTLYFSFYRGDELVKKYVPLVDATMEIKLEATISHMYLEEMLHIERDRNIEKALYHLEQSKWYANAMLNGGINSEGTFLPLSDKVMREKIEIVLTALTKFKQMSIERFNRNCITKDGNSLYEEYNTLFKNFIKVADDVETSIQQLITDELKKFNTLKIILIITSSITLIVVIFYQNFFANRRLSFIKTIEDQNRLLTEQSNTDALTNIANRRYFDSFVKEKFAWAKRKHESVSVIMIDVDYFKKFNDTYGHTEGDKCLQKITLEIKHHLRRPTDLIARYGGEEFVVVLLDTNNIEEFIENIRKSIEALKIPNELSECSEYVTISAGVSTGIPSEDTEPYSLVQQADAALYMAKDAGRNSVIIG